MGNTDMEKDKSQQKSAPDKDQDTEVFEPVEVKDSSAKEQEKTPEQETPKEQEASQENKEQGENTEALKQQIADINDRYIRLMAEFDNYKKRVSREYEKQVESANEKLMVEMIDVRENFERAIRSTSSGADSATLLEGMKLIFNKFDGVLSRNGLEPFAEKGESFDPQVHDALMKTPHNEIPEDHIAEIYERGYKLKSKVVKHAKVIVSSGAPASPEGNKDSKDSK